MTRNLKALGLALVACFAMSAVAASAASAQDLFYADEENTILTGEQENINKFAIEGTSVIFQCPVARFAGTATGEEATEPTAGYTAEEITVYAEYSGEGETPCNLEPFGEATVEMNECHFVLTTETVEHAGEKHAPVHVVCEGGSQIEIQGPGCTIKIGEQTPTTGGVTYANETVGETADDEWAVTVNSTVSGIHFTSSGFLCGFVGVPSSGTNGTYNGAGTIKGFKDPEATHHAPPYNEEGEQRSIWVHGAPDTE